MDVSGQPLHKYSDMSPSFRILLCHWVGWYKTDSQFLVDLKQAEKGFFSSPGELGNLNLVWVG